jgi:hypothetical protein
MFNQVSSLNATDGTSFEVSEAEEIESQGPASLSAHQKTRRPGRAASV